MVGKDKFKEYVSELIGKDKEKLNNLRQDVVTSGLPLIFVGAFIIIFSFFLIFISGQLFGLVLLVLGVVFAVLGGANLFKNSSASKYYKEIYGVKVIDFLLNNYKYEFEKDGFIQEKIFKDSQFAKDYDDYKGCDKLLINIPNDDETESECNLILCDLDVTETKEDSDGNEYTDTVYEGVFGYVHFPFSFKCILCVNTTYSGKKYQLERVKLEDINFNKKFGIYSDNQIEARYILTPNMMEKLLYIIEKFPAFKLTLVDNKMYIGFNENLFEINSFKNNDVSSIFDGFYDEIEGILNIVNEIKTNNKVFKI